jgi:hypothetical protein
MGTSSATILQAASDAHHPKTLVQGALYQQQTCRVTAFILVAVQVVPRIHIPAQMDQNITFFPRR